MVKHSKSVVNIPETRPSLDPIDRESQLISLALNVAEQQLRDGTASPSVIAHFLKLGSTKERIEQEILAKQKELITAKTESLQSEKRMDELYIEAINAMKTYSGKVEDETVEIF